MKEMIFQAPPVQHGTLPLPFLWAPRKILAVTRCLLLFDLLRIRI